MNGPQAQDRPGPYEPFEDLPEDLQEEISGEKADLAIARAKIAALESELGRTEPQRHHEGTKHGEGSRRTEDGHGKE